MYIGQYTSVFSLEQLISMPARLTNKTCTLIDHALTKSSLTVSQYSIYCTRKTSSFKLKKQNEISFRNSKKF